MPSAVKQKRKRTRSPELFALVAGHFRVLGEPARLELLHALEAGERSVAFLMTETGTSQANLSKHMAVLCAAGFVRKRRDGQFVYYELGDESVLALCELMCRRVEASAANALAVFGSR